MKLTHPLASAAAVVLLATSTACAPPRAIDGSGNNDTYTDMGAANTALARFMTSDYSDGESGMSGATRPSPRAISNAVADQPAPIPNEHGASDFVWQWGQFLDHDIDISFEGDEIADIPVPAGDPEFDPFNTGTAVIPFHRSVYMPGTGESGIPREQMNGITSWIDASNVYGSDAVRAAALRKNDGSGELKTSPGRLLPFNVDGLDNAGGPSPDLFVAGDIRANEQVGLTAMHTLWVREHNLWARIIRSYHRGASGDVIYESARQVVGAEMQVVTFEEFLPALLGPGAISPYAGYDPNVDGSIMNVFSSAVYRFGHSMLSHTLLRLDANLAPIPAGHLSLADAFFDPDEIIDNGGIDPILRGLSQQVAQRVDTQLVDGVRNLLFGPPGAGGLDLASLNIQRGRDHGVPSYNDAREAMGFPRALDFDDVSSDIDIQNRLASVYANVDEIDLWVGALSEDHVPGGLVGPLAREIMVEQFEALRDGDKRWYENSFPPVILRWLKAQKFSTIIRRNTGIRGELQRDVFHVPAGS